MKTQPTCFGNGKLPFPQLKITKSILLTLICLALVTGSCNINPDLSRLENTPVSAEPKALSNATLLPGTASSIVSLNRVDLYLLTETATRGGVILVTIRDSKTSAIIASTSQPVDSFVHESWVAFNFTPALNLIRGSKYQIHVSRVGQENTSGNAIFWRSSSEESYPDGTNSVAPSGRILDFAFKTYTQGVIDQQQTMTNYGFSILTTATRWQEFKADLVIPIKL